MPQQGNVTSLANSLDAFKEGSGVVVIATPSISQNLKFERKTKSSLPAVNGREPLSHLCHS
jgi:hypothetical protein